MGKDSTRQRKQRGRGEATKLHREKLWVFCVLVVLRMGGRGGRGLRVSTGTLYRWLFVEGKKKAHTEPSGPSRDADGGVVVRGGSGSNCFGVAKPRREHAVEARHNNPREMMKKTTNQKIVCRDGNTTENENLAHTSFYVRNTYVEFEHIGISMGVYFFGL